MKAQRIENFIRICQEKIDPKIWGYMVPFPAGDVLYIKMGRFILEKQEVLYLLSRINTPAALWINYIKPMRQRVGLIRHPVDWRLKKGIDNIAQTMG